MSNVGQATPFSDASEFNTLQFVIARALDKIQTVSIVRVMGVNAGAQTVDVQVLVNLLTGSGTSISHGTIYACPYFRLQGGASGVICDPAAGDIGVMVFASRDSSNVIAAKGQANPGSNRKFSWSDGLYIGGLLNSAPTQYLQFTTGGATLETPAATVSGSITAASVHANNGYTGTFATGDSRTATVVNGIITSVA